MRVETSTCGCGTFLPLPLKLSGMSVKLDRFKVSSAFLGRKNLTVNIFLTNRRQKVVTLIVGLFSKDRLKIVTVIVSLFASLTEVPAERTF